MHPNPLFRTEDRALIGTLIGALIAQIGFGMVFPTTPGGPRVAQAPLRPGRAGSGSPGLARPMRTLGG